MKNLTLIVLSLSAAAAGCSSSPAAPTIERGPAPASIATARPDVWDSRDELAAWVTNGISAGAAAVVGDGNDAVIRIDVPGGTNLNLRSPAFGSAVTDLKTIRLRYRWRDATGRYGTNGQYLSINVYLQPATYDLRTGEPWLFIVVPSRGDSWIEQNFTPNQAFKPPFAAIGAAITMCGVCGEISGKGQLEIDWIQLVRSTQ